MSIRWSREFGVWERLDPGSGLIPVGGTFLLINILHLQSRSAIQVAAPSIVATVRNGVVGRMIRVMVQGHQVLAGA